MDTFLLSIAIPALMAIESPGVVTDTSAWTAAPAAPAEERSPDGRASCNQDGRQLCYDAASGRIVYRKTRDFMPGIPGLQAEHISVKRDRVTLKYSFR